MLVTTTEWLSPQNKDGCYDRRGAEKNPPPKIFQMNEKKSSSWRWNRRSALQLRYHFGLCSRKSQNSTVNVVGVTGWGDGEQLTWHDETKCASSIKQTGCQSKWALWYWLCATPLQSTQVKTLKRLVAAESCNQNKSPFTAEPLKTPSSSSLTESVWRGYSSRVQMLWQRVQILLYKDPIDAIFVLSLDWKRKEEEFYIEPWWNSLNEWSSEGVKWHKALVCTNKGLCYHL